MHANAWPPMPALPQLALPPRRHPSALRRLWREATPARAATRCRAGTLPPIDDLAEACAPEGALYVDGVLFGGDAER